MFLFLPFPRLLKYIPRKTFVPVWVYELGLLAVLLFQESIYHFSEFVRSWSFSRTVKVVTLYAMSFKWLRLLQTEVGNEGAQIHEEGMMILNLPELALECVLAKLSPAELCKMGAVCRYLRGLCTGDHLWKRHMSEKWGRVVGEAAYRKWDLQIAERKDFSGVRSNKVMNMFTCRWPFSWLKQKMKYGRKRTSNLPVNSLMSFYTELENGRFTFPAQIYNRENGSSGFLLSCYDAEISYNSRKNKFYARYPPHGKRVPAIEEVPWERIRAPSVITSSHDLHISVCLTELIPGDHIEIQWRRDNEFPYGWWYGIVGHLESCSRNEHRCYCHASDAIVLEFNHYALGSRWRKKMINRKDHKEDGNEDVGFYGGIRKVLKKEEVSMWMQFWPVEVIE